MGLRIISKQDGFRRCGVVHTAAATVHPDGRFSKEEIETLKAEPMLVVEEVEVEVEDAPGKSDKSGKKGKK